MILAAWIALIVVSLYVAASLGVAYGGYLPTLVVIAALLALYILTACTATEPVEQTCKSQGWSDSAKGYVWIETPCQTARVGQISLRAE